MLAFAIWTMLDQEESCKTILRKQPAAVLYFSLSGGERIYFFSEPLLLSYS